MKKTLFQAVMCGALLTSSQAVLEAKPSKPSKPAQAPAGPRFQVQRTPVVCDARSRIAVGDGIIVFSPSGFQGVDYMAPGDTAGRGIPGGSEFSAGEFRVCGKKILLSKNFLVSIYDTENKKMTEIPESEIRLASISDQMYGAQSIVADGSWAVVRNYQNSTADGAPAKAIDLSGSEPRLIPLQIPSKQYNVTQMAVDGKAKQAVVIMAVSSEANVFDLTHPESPTKVIKLSDLDAPTSTPPILRNGKLIYIDSDPNDPHLTTLDVNSGAITKTKTSFHASPFACNGSAYCAFVNRDANDSLSNDHRGVIGTLGGEPNLTVATGALLYGNSKQDGAHGFGSSAFLTSDGKIAFIAGQAEVGDEEHLAVSENGGKFQLFPEPGAKPPYFRATHVVGNDGLVAFKYGDREKTKIGFIKLR